MQVISSTNEAVPRLSPMSLTPITFRTLTIGLGHYMTEVWIQMWLSLPFWMQKIFHLGFPPQNTDIFCIISLMEKVVLEFLILAVMLSLLGNCFSFIDSKSFTPCHPPWPRFPWPDCRRGAQPLAVLVSVDGSSSPLWEPRAAKQVIGSRRAHRRLAF